MKEADDPCVAVGSTGGRGSARPAGRRTAAEIRAWRKMTPFRRAALERELPRRLHKSAAAVPRSQRD